MNPLECQEICLPGFSLKRREFKGRKPLKTRTKKTFFAILQKTGIYSRTAS
jgi:hypothetical protein